MSVKIIIDSTVDTSAATRGKCTIVPLTVRFGDTEYTDGVTISHQEFYQKLVSSKELPTTSQPTPDAFAQEYQKVVDAGDTAVVLTIASKLSGTYQSATIAAMDFPEKIFVVDSRNATIGSGILAELAVRLAEEGKTAKEIFDTLLAQREKVRLFAMVDTLEYLKKGGRVSKTVAFAGELLSIKPLIQVLDGKIEMAGKARGSRQANAMLQKQVETIGVDLTLPYILGYTGTESTLLEKFIAESGDLWANADTTIIGSAIGTHAGPGAFATAFFTN